MTTKPVTTDAAAPGDSSLGPSPKTEAITSFGFPDGLPKTRPTAKGHATVRRKLLALVLLPVLLALPATLALAVYWGGKFGFDQLFIKVSTDLSVAEDVFTRAQRTELDRLARLAESFDFRTAYARSDFRALARQIAKTRTEAGFGFLHLTDRQGRILRDQDPLDSNGQGATRSIGRQSRPSPLLERALLGEPSVGIEVYSATDLAQEAPALANRVRLELLPTPRAQPSQRRIEDRAMIIRAVYPVRDDNDNVRAVLDGGLILNGNFDFVDSIRNLVYGPGSLPRGSIGTVTVFLDDVRISTNVPLAPGERALGTRVSAAVRRQVLEVGEPWIDRAFVVNDWYISAYQPIVDVAGRRVGMLYAGFLEAPFRADLNQALMTLVLSFAGIAAISALLGILGAKSIFQPLETMSAVVGATRAGRDRRVGPVKSRDEIGTLAREFDAMLDLLAERNRQVLEAADSLERTVEERTAELKNRNTELEGTIEQLRATRSALVQSEKLAALGELSAGMAHEINNPMAVILGNLDVLDAELGDAAEPVRGEIQLIIAQVYRVKDIIDSLLQYARPADYAGWSETLDVNELVQETLKLVAHLRSSAGVEIALELTASHPVRIARQDLQQVLVNLLVNAIHAQQQTGLEALPESGRPASQSLGQLTGHLTGQVDNNTTKQQSRLPRNGTIMVRTEDWEDEGVRIQVTDSGPGIAPELIDIVFTPFFSTKRAGAGTGLGLFVSHLLMRRHGGKITVRTNLGRGAEFTLWLRAEPRVGEDDRFLAEGLEKFKP